MVQKSLSSQLFLWDKHFTTGETEAGNEKTNSLSRSLNTKDLQGLTGCVMDDVDFIWRREEKGLLSLCYCTACGSLLSFSNVTFIKRCKNELCQDSHLETKHHHQDELWELQLQTLSITKGGVI